MKRVLKFIFLIFIFLISFNVDASSKEEIRNAVIETAEAYYRKGVNVQYDTYRRNMTFSPEDATDQSTVYTVCSGFTQMVYYQTLGISIPPYTQSLMKAARENKNENFIVLYLDSNTIFTPSGIGENNSSLDDVVNNWKNIVNPGDILVIRRANKTGHAMLFAGEENGMPYVLESTGSTYVMKDDSHTEKFETAGSIKKTPLSNLLTAYYNGKNSTSKITELAIIRFINDDHTYIDDSYAKKTYENLTNIAKTRLSYPKIDIEKTTIINNNDNNVNVRSSVTPNDTITFNIKITNNSQQDYKDLIINENIHNLTTVLEKGNGSLSGNKLSFTIDKIPKGESKTISYKVRVLNNSSYIGQYITSTGMVNDMPTRTINLYISESLTFDEQKKIVSKFNELTDADDNAYDIEFITKTYQEALGLDIDFLNDKSFNAIVTADCSTDICKLSVTEDSIKKITLSNYYGIRLGSTTSLDIDSNSDSEVVTPTDKVLSADSAWNTFKFDNKNDRVRDVTFNDLQIGDIIIYRTETANVMYDKAYIYLGDETLGRRYHSNANNKNVTVYYADGTNGTSTKGITLIRNLIYDNFIVLRPANLINRNRSETEFNVEKDNLDQDKNKDNNNVNKQADNSDNSQNKRLLPAPNTFSKINYIIITVGFILLIFGLVSVFRLKNQNKKQH